MQTNDFTMERIDAYHHAMGEDFCDQEGGLFDHVKLGSWLIKEFPEYEVELRQAMDHKFGDLLDLKNVFEEALDNVEATPGQDLFYNKFCEYMNQNPDTEEVLELERILIRAGV